MQCYKTFFMNKASEIFGDCNIDLLPKQYKYITKTAELLKEKRLELKVSLNKMSKDLYGNRNYVNYLSKIEKGDIPNVSYEVIMNITTYLENIEDCLIKRDY